MSVSIGMKKIKVFCDPLATAMASVWLFIAMPFCSAALIYGTLIYEKNGIETVFDVIIVVIFYLLDIITYAISIYCLPQWFASVKLTNEGIIYQIPFRKKEKMEYDQFNYVKIAYYTHIFKKRYFLVMSKKHIPASVLCNINQLKPDETVVKVSLSKRNYSLLYRVLPDNIKNELKLFYDGCKTDIAFDIDAETKRIHRSEKRKRKSKKK